MRAFILLLFGSAVTFCAEPQIVDARTAFPELEGHTLAGNIKIIDAFEMPQLGRTRRIWIYLPPGYDTSAKRYPALYMQDGQNVFDRTTSFVGEWYVDEALEKLFAAKQTRGVIVVAVENGREKRAEEYVPSWMPGLVDHPRGNDYAAFVAKTLKPFIDSRFRTDPRREATGVAGSSAGAIISFHIGMEYPDVFSKIGAFSFTIPGAGADHIEDWRASHKRQAGMRVYLHIGTAENISSKYPAEVWIANLKKLHAALESLGYGPGEVKLDVQEGGEHNEKTWAARFPAVFSWLYENL